MDPLDAYHLALDLMKKAGFTLHTASRQSEACYYSHPSRHPLLLRVAMHPSKKSPMGLQANTLARVTISPHDRGLTDEHHGPLHVENLVAIGIGRYFLKEPKPSNYIGKKGTWEHLAVHGASGEGHALTAKPEVGLSK